MIDVPVGYKQTDVGVIPEDWEVKSIGDIVSYIKGFPFKSVDYRNSGTRIIRISDTTADSIKNGDEIYLNDIEAEKHHKWRLKESDLIVSTVGSKPPMYDSMVGKVILVKKEYNGWLLNQNAVLITMKDSKTAISQFLYGFFSTKRYVSHIEAIFRGNANQASITLPELFNFKIPSPSFNEQTAIATALSDVDALLNQLDKLIAKKRDIKQATMQQLLTGKKRLAGFGDGKGYKQTEIGEIPEDWEVVELGDCIRLVVDNRGKTPPLARDGFPMIEVNAVFKQGRSPNIEKATKYVSNTIFESWFRDGHPQSGDILVVTVGSAGETSFVNNEGYCIAQNLISLRIRSNFDNEFIYYLTTFNPFKKLVDAVLMGAVQPSLKVPYLKKFRLSMPVSKEEQTAIATLLTDMDTEITQLQQRRHKTHALKQGMMQQLLTGKIRLI